MKLLTVEEFINDFYKNKKNDPAKPFLLASKSGKELYRANDKKIMKESIAIGIPSIGITIMILHIVAVNHMLPNFWLTIAILFPFVTQSHVIAKFLLHPQLQNISNYNYKKNGVPANFVYSLRSWLNSKYDMSLSDAQVVSLLTAPRTTLDDNRYRLVYSKDKDYINEMIMDNSCPSDCCDKTNTDSISFGSANGVATFTI